MSRPDSISENNLADLLIDCSIDAMIGIDLTGNIIAFNTGAEKFYGIAREKALNLPLTSLIPEIKQDKDVSHALELAFKGFKSFVPADKNFPYRSHSECHFIPLLDKSGIAIGVMKLIHDVSHRIKAESNLEQLNQATQLKNRQLERTLSEMENFSMITANQIKQPIRNLYTDVEHLIKIEAGKLSNSGKAVFRRIQHSLNKMNLVLDDVLKLSQIGIAGSPADVSLDEVIEVVKSKAASKLAEANAQIKIEKLCIVTGDKILLEILFYQLTDNAIKFNESPRPVVLFSCDEVEYMPADNNMPGMFYRISVTDNGMGISEQYTEKIFILFEKGDLPRKFKGTGVGLALCRKIMHAHNGYINAQSCPGKGSTINCYFPIPGR